MSGIDGKTKWSDDGKQLSRNYRQGNRVYSAEGIATTLTSQPVGGTGGFTSLYLVKEWEEINDMTHEQLTIDYYLDAEEPSDTIGKPTESKPFTYASVFAGIGGMTLGLKQLGGIGVAAWEYDPTEKRRQYAQDAHKLLHPEIPVYGDVCEADTSTLPDFDVLCFTPPCQAFSVAGKRGGFEDTRGTLTFEALRIAKDKKPKALFMENVKGLVNHDGGNTMSVILHAINEIGYTVDFTVLNSKFFDVAQNRERVYLIALRNDLIESTPWVNTKGSSMLAKAKRIYLEEGARTFNFDWPEQTEVRTRLRDFLEENVDEKYYLSEDKTAKLVSQLEEGLAVKEATKQGYTVATEGDSVNTQFPSSTTRRGRVGKQIANALEVCGDVQGVVERTDRIIEVGKLKEHRHSSLANSVHSPEGISSTLDTMQGGGREPKIAVERFGVSMNRHEIDREVDVAHTLMARDYKGFGNQNMTGVMEVEGNSPIMLGHIDLKGHDAIKRVYDPNGQGPTLTTMGGGHREPKIAVDQIGIQMNRHSITKETDIAHCLMARDYKGFGNQDMTGVAVGEYPRYRIRKLTPRECLRLQSVPEDAIDKLSAEFSDSRLYKFAGNGLTTNVIKAIGERLVKYL